MKAIASKPLAFIDGWFLAPEDNAAVRMGIYRIVFGLAYLWHLSNSDFRMMWNIPDGVGRVTIGLADAIEHFVIESYFFYAAMDPILASLLVFLIVGYRVRFVTVALLILGVVRESLFSQLGVKDGHFFLTFYVPLFMAIAGTWGETYSIDARDRQRRTGVATDPADSAGRHFVAARCLLLVLVVLMCTSPLFKAFGEGSWLTSKFDLAELMVDHSAKGATYKFPGIPLSPILVMSPTLATVSTYGVLLFEALFFFVLFGRNLRLLCLSMVLIFHAINEFTLFVIFTPVLVVYGLFVNWAWVASKIPCFGHVPLFWRRHAVAISLVTACTVAATWHGGASRLFNLWGVITWQSVWYVIGPIAVVMTGVALYRIVVQARGLVFSRVHS